MDFDEIVIGSGLSALGAVLGLGADRRVMVLCGPPRGTFSYYDDTQSIPCAYLGAGGLGNYWHGVIPTGLNRNFAKADEEDFVSLFARFYPHAEIRSRLGHPWLFVPWRPIRPRRELNRLAGERGDRLALVWEAAEFFRVRDRTVEVTTASGIGYAKRIWLAAGPLHTPVLLERSLGQRFSRGVVSDHVLCYVGQIENVEPPRIARTRDGLFLPASYAAAGDTLYTIRPARFAFKQLDYAIERRAVFGLPTGSAIGKIARGNSLGLMAEALYNRFGLFPSATKQSVYTQTLALDAYSLLEGSSPLRARPDIIRSATDAARAHQPFGDLRPSRRPDLHLPGIHLHHSLDLRALADAGINALCGPVQVIDASVAADIGPDHPSFSLMLAAKKSASMQSC